MLETRGARRALIIAAVALTIARAASAQGRSSNDAHTVEVSGGYSFLRDLKTDLDLPKGWTAGAAWRVSPVWLFAQYRRASPRHPVRRRLRGSAGPRPDGRRPDVGRTRPVPRVPSGRRGFGERTRRDFRHGQHRVRLRRRDIRRPGLSAVVARRGARAVRGPRHQKRRRLDRDTPAPRSQPRLVPQRSSVRL